MTDLIKRAVDDITAANHVVALTGAGISVESGIPPFRGKGGLWEKLDPMEFAHIDSFMRDPAKVWDILIREMKGVIDTAKPNDAHIALYRMQKLGKLQSVITQNVDGLHQSAGVADVIEFHGTFARQFCLKCGKTYETGMINLTQIPPTCECTGILRPDCVFFGEAIPENEMARSQVEASQCDLMLVIGTSAIVQPAAFMPVIARENGAKIIEINPEPTSLTNRISDYLIEGGAGSIMKQIADELEKAAGHAK